MKRINQRVSEVLLITFYITHYLCNGPSTHSVDWIPSAEHGVRNDVRWFNRNVEIVKNIRQENFSHVNHTSVFAIRCKQNDQEAQKEFSNEIWSRQLMSHNRMEFEKWESTCNRDMNSCIVIDRDDSVTYSTNDFDHEIACKTNVCFSSL